MRYLTVNELSRKLGGRSHSSLYRDVKKGRLPRPFKYGVLNYWIEHEVDEALTAQIDATRTTEDEQNDA